MKAGTAPRAGALAALLVVAALAAACGDQPVPASDHALVVEPLPSRPVGEEVVVGGPWPEGVWVANVTLTFVDRSGGGEETGWARLQITQTTTTKAGATRSQVGVSLRDAAGLGKDLVGDLDGLVYTFDQDARGLRVAGSERFLRDDVPAQASALLDERIFAGFAGSA